MPFAEQIQAVVTIGYQGWPDAYDRSIVGLFLLLIVALPVVAVVGMYFDLRRFLRSLRRALVVVSQVVPTTPYWSLRSRPSCLKALGLELPCTQQEVLEAYRERAKLVHPDRGGDLEEFLKLQKYFEQAMQLAEDAAAETAVASNS